MFWDTCQLVECTLNICYDIDIDIIHCLLFDASAAPADNNNNDNDDGDDVGDEVCIDERRNERADNQRARRALRAEDAASTDLRQQSSVSDSSFQTSDHRNSRQVSPSNRHRRLLSYTVQLQWFQIGLVAPVTLTLTFDLKIVPTPGTLPNVYVYQL